MSEYQYPHCQTIDAPLNDEQYGNMQLQTSTDRSCCSFVCASDVSYEHVLSDQSMTINPITTWQIRFAKATDADQLNLLREHLRILGLPDEPELLLKGTLLIVPMALAYRSMDGDDIKQFLDMQTYDPARARDATYLLTFDLYGRAYGRIAVDRSLRECDLADMFGAAWRELELCGYHGFYITRVDGRELSPEEVAELQELVEKDLYFDYSEDELSVWFDDSRSPFFLYADVSERDESLND